MRVLGEREFQVLEDLASRLDERGMTQEGRALREVLRNGQRHPGVRLPVAATILRMPPETVRNWVTRRLIGGQVDEKGDVFVDLDALEPVLELDAALPYADEAAPDLSDEEILAEIVAERAERRGG
jgi:hypothetical protein